MGICCTLYRSVFDTIQKIAGDWFLGLAARLVFSSVTMIYFINSALTKVGSGFPDFLIPTTGAYAQMLPEVAKSVGYDIDKISFFPYGLIVVFGTYAEFILPVLILIGLFTRLSALAMIGFIFVLTYVDIFAHGLTQKTIGMPFDRFQDQVVADQRLLWIFPLVYLVIRGAGKISVDGLMSTILFKK